MDLTDYVAFFEAEATGIDPEVGWTCGAHFNSTRGEDRIAAKIAPDDAEFLFDWWQGDELRASIHLTQVLGWDLECKPGKEVLRLTCGSEAPSYFTLQLKPFVAVAWVTQ